MSYRRLVQLALIVGIPRFAAAQFTTFIPPRAPTSDSAKAVVAATQRAKTDSAVQAQLTNMKTWVDSAAGLPPAPTSPNPAVDSIARPRTRTDSAAGAVVPPVRRDSAPVRRDSALTARGLRAPATASPLPLFAVTGAGLLLIGGVLIGSVRPSRNRA